VVPNKANSRTRSGRQGSRRCKTKPILSRFGMKMEVGWKNKANIAGKMPAAREGGTPSTRGAECAKQSQFPYPFRSAGDPRMSNKAKFASFQAENPRRARKQSQYRGQDAHGPRRRDACDTRTPNKANFPLSGEARSTNIDSRLRGNDTSAEAGAGQARNLSVEMRNKPNFVCSVPVRAYRITPYGHYERGIDGRRRVA